MTGLNYIYRWYWCVAFFWINDACGQDWSLDLHQSRIIGLGEQWHGSAEFIDMRCDILKHTVQNEERASLILESSFIALAVQFLTQQTAQEIVQQGLQPFWNDSSMCNMVSMFRDTVHCRLFGCDPLEDCRFIEWSAFMHKRGWFPRHGQALRTLDALIDPFIGPNAQHGRLPQMQRDSAFALIQVLHENAVIINPVDSSWVQQILKNRRWLVEFLYRPYDKHIMAFRDSVMYENVKFILSKCSKDAPVYLWAANLHLDNHVGGRTKFLGEYLYEELGASYLPILCRYQRWPRGQRMRLAEKTYRSRNQRQALIITTQRRRPLNYPSRC